MWRCFLIVPHVPRVEQIVLHGSGQTLHRSVVHRFEGFEWNDRMRFEDLIWPEICPAEGCEHRLEYETDDFDSGTRTLMGTTSWRRLDDDSVRDHQWEFGPGAMFEVDYMEWLKKRTPDGNVWGVVLPPANNSSIWIIDSEASSGGYWTRSGTPPDLSVTPSILIPDYHGFLGSNGVPAGYLSNDLEGRSYA